MFIEFEGRQVNIMKNVRVNVLEKSGSLLAKSILDTVKENPINQIDEKKSLSSLYELI